MLNDNSYIIVYNIRLLTYLGIPITHTYQDIFLYSDTSHQTTHLHLLCYRLPTGHLQIYNGLVGTAGAVAVRISALHHEAFLDAVEGKAIFLIHNKNLRLSEVLEEASAGFEPAIRVLQTRALPLG